MKPRKRSPAERVSDWRQVEPGTDDILAFTGEDGAAIVAITARTKTCFRFCYRDCAFEREARPLTADLPMDRSKLDSELYVARSPEVFS